jgi:hypothetical protein
MTTWRIAYNNGYEEFLTAEEYSHVCDKLLREREAMLPFQGDSQDYWMIKEAAEKSADVPGLFCEIGLRQGGGTKAIIDGVFISDKERTVIAIDPYGAIPYEGMEGETAPETIYTNLMQKETLELMYRTMQRLPKLNFIFFPLEDIEFFKRYGDGVPIYNHQKEIVNEYAMAHLDGPHNLATVMIEAEFFNARMKKGAHLVFDDVEHFYDHNKVEEFLFKNNWQGVHKTKHKASYKKVK